MEKHLLAIDVDAYPAAVRPILRNARVYDSHCRSGAEVLFIDRDGGYFLKSMEGGKLVTEAAMTRYFGERGLGAKVLHFESGARDYLLTSRVAGDDLTASVYLAEPKKLCECLAETLRALHERDTADCPVPNRVETYKTFATENYRTGNYDKSSFPDSFTYRSAEEAMDVIRSCGDILRADTLIHGDYCLPNVLFDGWNFSGFVDVGNGGVGDRHIDLFWGMWTLWYNLGQSKQYAERFLDAYGRECVEREALRVVAAYEVFG